MEYIYSNWPRGSHSIDESDLIQKPSPEEGKGDVLAIFFNLHPKKLRMVS